MKILYIQDSLGTGGAERSNLELWYFLRDRGIELKILVLKHRNEGVEQEVLQAGFDVVFLRNDGFIAHAFQIKNEIEAFSPDIVHSVLFKSNLRTRTAKLLTSFKHVESLVNCPYNRFRLEDKNVSRMHLLIYKKIDALSQKIGVDHFHANGLTVSRHYQDELKVPKEKISIINRGRRNIEVSQHDVENLRAGLKLDVDRVILMNVARHEFQKAQDKIIEAIAGSECLKEKCYFISVGRKGELTEKLSKKVQQSGLEEQVKFLGHRTDVHVLLNLADIFVFPSRFEGLPGALIEAESAGLPIICSDIENNLEVVEKDQNSLVFPVDNVEALREQLETMVGDPVLRADMGKRSKEIFKEKFLLDHINNQMLGFYKRIK